MLDVKATEIGDTQRALFAVIEENKMLRAWLTALRTPCECCGAPLRRVEFGRADCLAGCSYDTV
jgi:hypothetical protein